MQNTEQHAAMLVVCSRKCGIQQYKVNGKAMFGRKHSIGSSDICIEEEGMEETQGEIVYDDGKYIYRDLSGTNHTYYNGILLGSESMEGENKAVLHEGDLICIMKDTDTGRRECRAVIVFHRHFDSEVTWRAIELHGTEKKFYLSRHEEIKDAEIHPEGSLELPVHYAVMFEQDGDWYIEDHNTMLGVFLNARKIEKKEALKEMDLIRIGNTLFLYWNGNLYYDHRDISENSLVIHIEERSVWNLFRRKILLEDIDLTIYPGEMVLVLGGSGAGKTTFINAVMGYEKAKGEILAGDVNIYKNYNTMKYEIGFVPQQDLLRMEDDVYDTLNNAAMMKMPKTASADEREKRIQEVTALLGLSRQEHSLVGKLSGGQRKRLSIAVEYIADPKLFFLDEPDSGLDGVMARSLMENLRNIADEKKIVLVITHSPDRVADLFNKVIVLAKSELDDVGKLAFFGGIDEALRYFDTQ